MRIQAKELRAPRTVKLWEAVPLEGPWTLYLDPTNLCNFKCIFCPTGNPDMLQSVGRKNSMMTMKLFSKIVDDLKEMPKLKILGLYRDGEPLAHPAFTKMVTMLKEADVSEKIRVKTNGELISRHPDLATCGLYMLTVSVPHVTEKGIYKTVGKHVDYKKYVADIRKLFESERTFKLYTKIADTGLTDAEKDKFYSDFEGISDVCAIEGLHGWSGGANKLQIHNLGTHDGNPFEKKLVCPLPFYMMSIDCNGIVSGCNEDWGSYHQLGDANKNSISEIWNGNKYKDFRMMHLNGGRERNKACAVCQYVETLPDNIDQYAEEMKWRMA